MITQTRLDSKQTALSDFESMIAGKTHSEILLMTRGPRNYWYKKISPEEKKEAMRIVWVARNDKISAAMMNHPVSETTKAKISAARIDKPLTEKHKAKISAALTGRILSKQHKTKIGRASTGRIHTEKTKAKMSASAIERFKDPKNHPMYGRTGENAPRYGKTHTEETKAKIGAAQMGKKNHMYGKTFSHTEETKAKISASLTGKTHTEETRAKIGASWTPKRRTKRSTTQIGENNSRWQGGISFDPYCRSFNEPLKEHIRNLYNRTCTVCGTSILQYHKRWWKRKYRIHVDHLDENKMQGCDDWEWRLAPLCPSCHSKMQKRKIPRHLLLQLLLLNNKKHQINFLFEDEIQSNRSMGEIN